MQLEHRRGRGTVIPVASWWWKLGSAQAENVSGPLYANDVAFPLHLNYFCFTHHRKRCIQLDSPVWHTSGRWQRGEKPACRFPSGVLDVEKNWQGKQAELSLGVRKKGRELPSLSFLPPTWEPVRRLKGEWIGNPTDKINVHSRIAYACRCRRSPLRNWRRERYFISVVLMHWLLLFASFKPT